MDTALSDTEIRTVIASIEQILQSGNLVLGQHTEAFATTVALWVTERVGRLNPRSINEAFTAARELADLGPVLDPHCEVVHWKLVVRASCWAARRFQLDADAANNGIVDGRTGSTERRVYHASRSCAATASCLGVIAAGSGLGGCRCGASTTAPLAGRNTASNGLNRRAMSHQ